MQFGIAFPSWIDAWRDCEVAEAAGFTHAWFYDTQLLCSDVYATMALAAEHTRTMKLGTLVAIPSNRIAPVTASAIATINALAPGRVDPRHRHRLHRPQHHGHAAAAGRAHDRVRAPGARPARRRGRALPRGQVRALDPPARRATARLGCINLDDPIPIHIAANAPKALASVGEVGDGWISVAQDRGRRQARARRSRASARVARPPFDGPGGKPYTTMLTTGCILRPGEDVRARARRAPRRPGHRRRRARDLGELARRPRLRPRQRRPRRRIRPLHRRLRRRARLAAPTVATSTCTRDT